MFTKICKQPKMAKFCEQLIRFVRLLYIPNYCKSPHEGGWLFSSFSWFFSVNCPPFFHCSGMMTSLFMPHLPSAAGTVASDKPAKTSKEQTFRYKEEGYDLDLTCILHSKISSVIYTEVTFSLMATFQSAQ